VPETRLSKKQQALLYQDTQSIDALYSFAEESGDVWAREILDEYALYSGDPLMRSVWRSQPRIDPRYPQECPLPFCSMIFTGSMTCRVTALRPPAGVAFSGAAFTRQIASCDRREQRRARGDVRGQRTRSDTGAAARSRCRLIDGAITSESAGSRRRHSAPSGEASWRKSVLPEKRCLPRVCDG